MAKQIISLTEQAIARVKTLLAKRTDNAIGIRIGVKKGGCTGLSYTFEYALQAEPMDETINQDGVTILVDPRATMYIIGTTLDFMDDGIKSGFVFINPNEKGRCGCGESFHA